MKLKKFLAAGIASLMIAGSTMTSMAGQWMQFNGLWYYLLDNGQFATNQWAGNYYLGSDGHMLVNTWTPDGYFVGGDGKWLPNASNSSAVYSGITHNGIYQWAYTVNPGGDVAYPNQVDQRVISVNNDKSLTVVQILNGVTGSTSQVTFETQNEYKSVINGLRYSFSNGELVVTTTQGAKMHFSKIG